MIIGIFSSEKTNACDSHLVKNVTDDKLTASSIYSNDYPPFKARLSNAEGWSPKESQLNPWIQVDFGRGMVIMAVLTKGMGGFSEWVKKYQVRYSNTGSTWAVLQYGSTNEFNANTDSTSLVRNNLPFQVISRYLRIYPTDCHDYCSLRFDVVGCEVTSLSTTMASTTISRTTAGVKTTIEPSTTTSTDAMATTSTAKGTTSTQMPTTTSVHISATTASSTIVSTSPCPCTCVKQHNSTLTEKELRARLAGIVQNLTISKKTTSIYKRSKISAQDNRPQVMYVGSIGIAILIIVSSLIVLPDLFKLFQFFLCYTQ
ncbi:neuropilin-1a-like [Saccostrea echinata]|uniref:neuropilin-1a-like n=1 Tax=Saccostrea echinata TaxID=191078 RepID=UPI002A80936A|nr:neuropilin-1a-like [Saccostrea echinata]